MTSNAPSAPFLTDTHAHIGDAAFEMDRVAVLARAAAAGIAKIITVGEDLADAKKNISLARTHPILKSAAGLYPTHLDPAAAQALRTFIRRHHGEMVAIGEVGLDYWMVKDSAGRDVQREIFSSFIDLAIELELPLNVHSRSAGRHAVSLLLTRGARRVQMHAFDGKISAARAAVEAGYYFSIPPSVVRSRQKQKLVRHLPLESLLVETDSPVLGPDALARNEPANLTTAIDAIAAIKGLEPQAVIASVVANTRALYGF
jgi:TatD DNase family protein